MISLKENDENDNEEKGKRQKVTEGKMREICARKGMYIQKKVDDGEWS